MNLRDRRNLESALKRLDKAEKELKRARSVLAGVSKRANEDAEREAERKAEAAQKKTREWQRKQNAGTKKSGRRLSRGG